MPLARRPAVLDAARTALIPLRPLSIGEILDGAFLVVRRNARLMIGLPLVVAAGAAAYALAGFGMWILLGNTTSQVAQIVLTVVLALVGLLLIVQCVAWMTAVLSRISLQTVLGEGFAPLRGTITFASIRALFWPMLGLSLLQYVALSAAQTIIGLLYYLVLIATFATGLDPDSESWGAVFTVVLSALTFVAGSLAYGLISLTVPALSVEGRKAPGWIGKPARPTNPATAFIRSISLVGKTNLVRVTLIFVATFAICCGVLALTGIGTLALVLLYARSINVDVYVALANPWTIGIVTAASLLVALSVLLAYVASVQSLLYLDLRMRREGLDLAMRFDVVPVPQPSAPPAPAWIPPPPGWTGR